LFVQIKTDGYTGAYGQVTAFIRDWRTDTGKKPHAFVPLANRGRYDELPHDNEDQQADLIPSKAAFCADSRTVYWDVIRESEQPTRATKNNLQQNSSLYLSVQWHTLC
jgi:hypothetical protein